MVTFYKACTVYVGMNSYDYERLSLPRMMGRDSFEFSIMIILEFGESANFSVASIPFHCNRLGVMPSDTIH